jgi:uncharacterized membrane protein YphA (DoxX/SURF4 family)/peroxiredoxin
MIFKRNFSGRTAMDFIMLMLRVAFGSLFVASGILKLTDISSFQQILSKLLLFADGPIRAIAILLPVVEIILGAAIVIGAKTKVATQVTTLMLSLFTAVIVGKISEGTDFSCGCFGGLSKERVDGMTIVRNVGLLLVGILLLMYHEKRSQGITSDLRSSLGSRIVKFLVALQNGVRPIAMLLLLAFLMGGSLVLSSQNKILKERVELLLGSQDVLTAAAPVPSFVATNTEGKREVISYDGQRKTLLFVMKSSCGACKKNLQSWNNLAQSLKRANVRIIGVLLDSVNAAKKYIRENALDFSIVIGPEGDFRSTYKIMLTPLTFLVSKGRVEAVWKGALNAEQQREILKAAS